MFDLPAIGKRIRTQDNRITADPIFLVEECVRIYGIGLEYDPQIVWLHADESVEVDAAEALKLEREYQISSNEPEAFRRVGYVEQWHYVQPFFTEAAADLYIKQNAHRRKWRLRTYVDSAYRNYEWQAVRKHLMEMPAVQSLPNQQASTKGAQGGQDA